MSEDKIWSGRFQEGTDALMEQFSVSLHFDQKLFDADIAVNKAWARVLVDVGVYTKAEAEQVDAALDDIQNDFHAGALDFPDSAEDIHSATERWLTERLGDIGARIHTGRSRNDQVTTDFRIYLRKENRALQNAAKALQQSLLAVARRHTETILPGQTHLRQAQPLSFAHYVLAFFFQLQRDRDRLQQTFERCNVMPLGSGALAGAAFEIDRQKLAKMLGFDAPMDNSYDATADRDFVTEFLFACAQIMVHLSRLAEDLIIWSSEGFRFVQIDEKYSTGSSMMPQKRNPDSLELIRGKSARVISSLMTLLTLQKGAPTAYVRDLQEDKEPAFDAIEQTMQALQIFSGVVRTLQVDHEQMLNAIDPALYATDLADYLVRKGMPFRQAHSVVGSVVAYAEQHKMALNAVPLEAMQDFSGLFDRTVYDLFHPSASLSKRNIQGGTGKKSVEEQIKKAERLLEE